MKGIVLPILGVVGFSAAFVYLLHEPAADRSQANADSIPRAVLASPEPEQAPIAVRSGDAIAAQGQLSAAPQTVDFEAIKRRFGVTYDPMLVMALGDFSDAEIDAYNELHVLPFNRAVDNDCQELPDPEFADQFYTTCKTVREYPEHPYHDLAAQELRLLAVHDAVAALVLGRRTLGEEERLYWYLRAAALSEKTGPLMALAERRYGSAFKLQAVDGQVAQVPQPDAMIKRLALETVAGKLGDPRANPERWRRSLLETAGDESASAMARADALVTEFLENMADAQRRVTGSVQVQGVIDA